MAGCHSLRNGKQQQATYVVAEPAAQRVSTYKFRRCSQGQWTLSEKAHWCWASQEKCHLVPLFLAGMIYFLISRNVLNCPFETCRHHINNLHTVASCSAKRCSLEQSAVSEEVCRPANGQKPETRRSSSATSSETQICKCADNMIQPQVLY